MAVPLYEHPVWESLPDQVMRPGGLILTERAFSFAELASGSRVLDLGCGLGATLRHLSADYGLAAFGVDVSSPLLGRADRDDKVAFVQAPDGLVYVYGGAGQLTIRVGDVVRKGSQIGRMATTDEAKAYFFVFRGQEALDPVAAPRD